MASSEPSSPLLPNQCWLSIVGIGEDGVDGLGVRAKELIRQAAFVFGGARHLALAESLIDGEVRQWPSPFDAEMKTLLALRGQKVCVLASGDPFLYGVGVTLSRVIAHEEMTVVPAPSSFSLAASRLGWALQDVDCLSLHGKPVDLIRPCLFEGRRILALTSDGYGPVEIAALLCECGFGASTITVLEALGGPQERVRSATAESFAIEDVNPLNIVALEIEATGSTRITALSCGLDDDMFEHDGQLTKREIRALTLSTLAPRKGELLWDIGAGSGSVAIEWLLRDRSLRAIAIEADPERAQRIARNARAFGVPDLEIVCGEAPAALAGLSHPQAAFIGGGGSEPGVIEAAIAALTSSGRLVANAVTLEMEAVLLRHHSMLGGSLTRIDIARAAPVGSMHAFRPALPIVQWAWVKP